MVARLIRASSRRISRNQFVGAEMSALAQEDIDDEVALAGAATAGGPMRFDELQSATTWAHQSCAPARTHARRPDTRHRRAPSRTVSYALNDDPQPQVDLAFGFLMVNPPPMLLSTKSTSAPCRYAGADGIDEQLDAVRLEHLVGRLVPFAFVDHQAVLETRAAATLDEHAQAGSHLVFFDQQLSNL